MLPVEASASSLQMLAEAARAALGAVVLSHQVAFDELTLVFSASGYLHAAFALRDHPDLFFDTLVDLCGIDYKEHPRQAGYAGRFAVVLHLLSVRRNQRLRVKVFCAEDDFPVLDSVTSVWPVSDWYEREAFDLYGIAFSGHPDLRRILTDYGFVGYPFRKDFPISGHVESFYDLSKGRVAYRPVTIEPREIVPRIIREEGYGHGRSSEK